MHNLIYFIKLFAFWLIYFFINRLFFILYYFEEFSQFTANEILRILPNSFGLDISFIAYLCVIIIMFLFLNSMISSKRFSIFISGLIYWINSFFIVITALIIGGETSLYAEWQTKLNFAALSHFSNPSEVFLTATYSHYFTMLIAIFIAVVFVNFYAYFVHH